MSDNSQRIIFDPEDYDKAIEAAAADLAHKIQSYFRWPLDLLPARNFYKARRGIFEVSGIFL